MTLITGYSSRAEVDQMGLAWIKSFPMHIQLIRPSWWQFNQSPIWSKRLLESQNFLNRPTWQEFLNHRFKTPPAQHFESPKFTGDFIGFNPGTFQCKALKWNSGSMESEWLTQCKYLSKPSSLKCNMKIICAVCLIVKLTGSKHIFSTENQTTCEFIWAMALIL